MFVEVEGRRIYKYKIIHDGEVITIYDLIAVNVESGFNHFCVELLKLLKRTKKKLKNFLFTLFIRQFSI